MHAHTRARTHGARCRREVLLEASRRWISREMLVDSINAALDNPQPFGFVVTNLPKQHF